MKKIFKTELFDLALASLLMLVAALIIFQYQGIRRYNDNWVAPYLSAAANLNFGGHFMIDEDQIHGFQDLTPSEENTYKFSRGSNTSTYTNNEIGYVYIVWA